MIPKSVRNDPPLTFIDTGRTHGTRHANIGTTILNQMMPKSASEPFGYTGSLQACHGRPIFALPLMPWRPIYWLTVRFMLPCPSSRPWATSFYCQ
jgi:hypothetical protein